MMFSGQSRMKRWHGVVGLDRSCERHSEQHPEKGNSIYKILLRAHVREFADGSPKDMIWSGICQLSVSSSTSREGAPSPLDSAEKRCTSVSLRLVIQQRWQSEF